MFNKEGCLAYISKKIIAHIGYAAILFLICAATVSAKDRFEGKYVITKGDKPYGEEYFRVVSGEEALYGSSSFVPAEMKGKIKKHAGTLRSHIMLSEGLELRKFKKWWNVGKKEMYLSTFIYKDSLRIRMEDGSNASVKEMGSPKSISVIDPNIFYLFNFIIRDKPKAKKEMQVLIPVLQVREIFKLEPAGEEEVTNLKGEAIKVEKYLFSGGSLSAYIYSNANGRVVMVVLGDMKAVLE